jgi:hypothetical protein
MVRSIKPDGKREFPRCGNARSEALLERLLLPTVPITPRDMALTMATATSASAAMAMPAAFVGVVLDVSVPPPI